LARAGDNQAGRGFFDVAKFKQPIAQVFGYRSISGLIDLLQSIKFSSSEKFIETRHLACSFSWPALCHNRHRGRIRFHPGLDKPAGSPCGGQDYPAKETAREALTARGASVPRPCLSRLGQMITSLVRPKQYLALCIKAALSRYKAGVMPASIVERAVPTAAGSP